MSAIGGTTPGTAWFLEGISALQNEQTQVQKELSSGYQVSDASDAPAQTPELVELGSSLAQVQAYQTNLTSVQAETSTADQSLSAAISLVQNAQSLAAEGANTTTSAATQQNLATQIQGIQQQLVSLANTTVQGRFIFGGDNDGSAPYAYDAASLTTGVNQLTTPQVSTRAITNPAGQTVYQSLTAQQIFDPTDATTGLPTANNTFAALESLVTDLSTHNTAGIAGDVTALSTASTYLSGQQAYYGNAEQRLTSEVNSSANQSTALQVQISGIRDTDVTQAATELTQLSTDESAAYAAQAAIPVKSLFDYLG
jgi:flagellar hook-associated protein 3 FlgL